MDGYLQNGLTMVKNALKVIAVNLTILLLLLVGINFLLVLLYEVQRLLRNNDLDNRGRLPNYDNISWAEKHYEEHDNLRSEYESYIGWRRTPFSGETINIDDHGIRNTPQHESTREDAPVVVFLGGSTMWGTGVNDHNTIPALFSRLAQGRYRTINFGEANYRAYQGYLFLQREIHKGLKPHVVIAYDGVNELHGFKAELDATDHEREFQIRSIMKGQDTGHALTLKNFLLGPIQSFILRYKKRTGVTIYNYDLTEQRTQQVAKALLDSWMATKALAEYNGATYMAVLQPNTGVGQPNLRHISIDANLIEPYQHLYPAVLDILEEDPSYEELSGHFTNLSDTFDGNEYFYVDFCHVTPNGNQLIAEQLLERLDQIDTVIQN
jgi:hypothetical protein